MMRKILYFVCSALLVAGLCGCEKMIPEVNLTDNLEGSWEKVYPEGARRTEGTLGGTRSEATKVSRDSNAPVAPNLNRHQEPETSRLSSLFSIL